MAENRTLDQLIDSVVLKDFESRDDIEDEIIEWLSDGYLKMGLRDLECFSNLLSFNTSSAKDKYWMDSIAPHYRKMQRIESSAAEITFQPLPKSRLMTFAKAASLRETGLPTAALYMNKQLYLDPIPDSAYPIYMLYYMSPERITDTSEIFQIPPEREDLLILYAQAQYDFKTKDIQASIMQEAKFYAELDKWEVDEFNDINDYTKVQDLQGEWNTIWMGGTE